MQPRPRGARAYRGAVAAFAVIFIGLGTAMLVLTAARGGGAGFLFGALFVALGAGRLYMLRRGPS
jgi:hypothetical protein